LTMPVFAGVPDDVSGMPLFAASPGILVDAPGAFFINGSGAFSIAVCARAASETNEAAHRTAASNPEKVFMIRLYWSGAAEEVSSTTASRASP
jgi:hypothetical protein